MKLQLKRLLTIVLTVALVFSLAYVSWDHQLRASDGDGSVTAAEQQQQAEQTLAPVEVIVPPAEEPAPAPVVEEAAPAPVVEEPAPAPVVEEPAPAPVVEEPAPAPVVEEPAPVVEEPAPAPVVEEPAPVVEEVVVEKPVVEEPVAEEPAPVVEEPAVEEPVVEEPAVEEVVAEEPVAEEPVAEEPVAEEPVVEEVVDKFANASVTVRMQNQGDIYFGDYVTLLAEVNGVADGASYSIRWQTIRDQEKGWEQIGSGSTYSFTVSESNATLPYRAVLVCND